MEVELEVNGLYTPIRCALVAPAPAPRPAAAFCRRRRLAVHTPPTSVVVGQACSRGLRLPAGLVAAWGSGCACVHMPPCQRENELVGARVMLPALAPARCAAGTPPTRCPPRPAPRCARWPPCTLPSRCSVCAQRLPSRRRCRGLTCVHWSSRRQVRGRDRAMQASSRAVLMLSVRQQQPPRHALRPTPPAPRRHLHPAGAGGQGHWPGCAHRGAVWRPHGRGCGGGAAAGHTPAQQRQADVSSGRLWGSAHGDGVVALPGEQWGQWRGACGGGARGEVVGVARPLQAGKHAGAKS